MKSKTYIKTTLSILFAGMVIILCFQVAIDPLFQYHKPWFRMKPLITNERYQYAGVLKNFSYDNVILGNSFCENFKPSSFNSCFEGTTIKAAVSGASPEDWSGMLNIIKGRNNQINRIVLNLDPYTLLNPKPEKKSALSPLYYLYDYQILNDVNFLYNFGTLRMSIDSVVSNANDSVPDLDSNFLIYSPGKEKVIEDYKRKQTDYADEESDLKKAIKNANWNLDFILPFFSNMKDTEFIVFFTPVSVLYWDKVLRDRDDKCWNEVYKLVCERLLPYDNVSLYLWSDDEMLSMISDIDNYKDEAHYTPEFCDILVKRIEEKEGLVNANNYSEKIKKLFDYIYGFDYHSLNI